MKTMRLKTFALASMLLLSGNAIAKTIYLSATGNDANDGTTAETAVATLTMAYTLATDGDIIQVNGMISLNEFINVEKNNLTIQGSNPETDGFDGNSTTPMLHQLNKNLTVKNVQIKDCYNPCNLTVTYSNSSTVAFRGGAISSLGGNPTFRNCKFVGNKTAYESNDNKGKGGAIFFSNSNLKLYDCTFEKNVGLEGGAVEGRGGSFLAENTTFDNNGTQQASGTNTNNTSGGALTLVDQGNGITITGCTFENNIAGGHGGALYLAGNGSYKMMLTGTRFEGNRAGGQFDADVNFTSSVANAMGGAIQFGGITGGDHVAEKLYTIETCTFVNNIASGYGGAVRQYNTNTIYRNCEFTGNNGYQGGAIFAACQDNANAYGYLKCYDSQIVNNTASNTGGAVRIDNVDIVEFDGCVVKDNTTNGGGGGFTLDSGGSTLGTKAVTFNQCLIDNNYAGNRGVRNDGQHGGAFNIGMSKQATAVYLFSGCTITRNSTTAAGGAFFFRKEGSCDTQQVNFVNCTITGNDTQNNSGNCAGLNYQQGGGILAPLNIVNCIIEGNRSVQSDNWSDVIFNSTPTVNVYNSIIGRSDGYGAAVFTDSEKQTTPDNTVTTLTSALRAFNAAGYYPLTVGAVSTTMGSVAKAAEFGVTTDQLGNALTKNYIGAVQCSELDFTMNTYGYATMYYGTDALVMPAGLTAKTYAQSGSALAVTKTYEAGDVVPQGVGVVLSGNEGDYVFTNSLVAGDAPASTDLKGSDVDAMTEGGVKYYKLGVKGGADPGFYWGADGGAAFLNQAHKAYLALPSASARSFFLFEDNGTTGIDNVDVNHNDNWYDLQGRRVAQPQKGLYIVNGKKVVF